MTHYHRIPMLSGFPRLKVLMGAVVLVFTAGSQMTGPVFAAPAAKAYVANFKDNTVSVIDTETRKVIATVPVVAGPHGMAITHDGRTVYVSGDRSSSLDVIDTSVDEVVKTINVGKAPNGLALTPDDRLLLVAVYGEDRIVVIDTAAQTVVGEIAVPKPHTVATSPDGRLAYVTVQEPGHFALALIDLHSRAIIRTVPLEKTPRDGEFGYDGRRFYFTQAGVGSVQVLDPASNKIVARIRTGVSPHFVGYPRRSAYGIIVVQGPGELSLFDPATNKPLRGIKVGKQPHWAATSADGKTAYVTDEGSNDVTAVELATGRTTTIAVGTAPRKIVVQRAATIAKKGS